MIFDATNDGRKELVASMTDRCVRVYTLDVERGRLTSIVKLEAQNQISSISPHPAWAGPTRNLLAIGQPGGRVIFYEVQPEEEEGGAAERAQTPPEEQDLIARVTEDNDLLEEGASSTHTSCEAVASLRAAGEDDDRRRSYAVVTFDGQVAMGRAGRTLWRMPVSASCHITFAEMRTSKVVFQVGQEMFGVHQMDVNGDGNDEVVVCSHHGHVSSASSLSQINREIDI